MAKLRTRVLWCAVCCAKSEFILEDELQVWMCSMCDAIYGWENE